MVAVPIDILHVVLFIVDTSIRYYTTSTWSNIHSGLHDYIIESTMGLVLCVSDHDPKVVQFLNHITGFCFNVEDDTNIEDKTFCVITSIIASVLTL